jgi:hypothetical protein
LLPWCVGGSSSSWGPYAPASIYCAPTIYLVQFLTYSPLPFSLLYFFYSDWLAIYAYSVELNLLYLNAFSLPYFQLLQKLRFWVECDGKKCPKLPTPWLLVELLPTPHTFG